MQATDVNEDLLASAEAGLPGDLLNTTNSDMFSSQMGMLNGQQESSAAIMERSAAEPSTARLRIKDLLQQHKAAGAQINDGLNESGDIRQFLRRGWKPPTQLHNASGAHPTYTPRSTAEEAPFAARPRGAAVRRSSGSATAEERGQTAATSSAVADDRLQAGSLGDRASLGSMPHARSMSLVRQPSLAERREMFTDSEIAQEALANSGNIGKCQYRQAAYLQVRVVFGDPLH